MISFRAIPEENFSDVIAMKRQDNAVARHVCDKPDFVPTGDVNHGGLGPRRVPTPEDRA